MTSAGKLYIARHGETVFNASRRLQGEHPHTPLSRHGFAQAEAMGHGLAQVIAQDAPLTLWASPTGRALQTLAIVAEHLGRDWHQARTDARLVEIGMGSWGGRYYADVIETYGPVIDCATGLLRPAPDGERYDAVATRVRAWLEERLADGGDHLVIMHGISGRVLRGIACGLPPLANYGVAVAPGLAQGSVAMICDGREQLVVHGTGQAPA